MSDGLLNTRLPTLFDQVAPGPLQQNITHVLSRALHAGSVPRQNPGCDNASPECEAEQYFGTWQGAFLSPAGPSESSSGVATTVSVEFVMLCPKPHWFNSGPHRAMLGLWYQGERYVIAVEEGAGERDLVQIGTLPGGSGEQPIASPEEAFELLSIAVRAITGYELYVKNRVVDFSSVDGLDLLFSGCTPTEGMSIW